MSSLSCVRVDQVLAPFLEGHLLSRSECEATIEVLDPSNGQQLIRIPVGCDADVDRAVLSCRRAFNDGRWTNVTPSLRAKTLRCLADQIARESAQFDALDAGEMGKPISERCGNAASAADLMRFHAESIDKVAGDVFSSDQKSVVLHRLRPRGVVAAVTPWNFPTFNAVLKMGPALAAGNCVVLKPSELSSRSAVRLAELAIEAGVPPGVLNVVLGAGETVGRALGLHRDVDMLTFTGSTDVGRLMLQFSGQSNMKVVMAECGGKSPQIVFADGVDLSVASEAIASFLVTNQGQICSVGSRLLVQRAIQAEMVERIVTRLKNIVMGNALNPDTTFGPLASKQQCARVLQYVEGAEKEGAKLITGGRRVMQDTGGFFVEPTVFNNVPLKARIAQEEIFGPVLSVTPFENEEEAVQIANDTVYGLMAYVWTANLSTGMRMANAIRSAVVVNSAAPAEGPGHAFSLEPTGLSGLGAEGGLPGYQHYLQRQLVWINHA